MFTTPARQASRPRVPARNAGARLRRLVAVLAALISGLVAFTATVPAAFAMPVPTGRDPIGGSAPATIVRVVTMGGMPGWQITLIAMGAAALAAAVAVLLYRALAARRAGSAATA